MPLPVSILLLCVPPIVITVAIGGALSLIAGFRRSFHAHRVLPTSAILVAIGTLLAHAGFFLAPLLLYTDRIQLALWLVIPISVLASLGLAWALIMTAGASDKIKRTALVALGGLAAYVLPVVVLVLNTNQVVVR